MHFRNHSSVEFDFADQLNFIIGPNGSGKTSLLDAIYYLSFTKSAFNCIDHQNIQHGQMTFLVEGQFVRHSRIHVLKCHFQQHGNKLFANNGNPYTKLRDHIGLFPVVLTTPYDIDLIRGESEIRRKFFDSILCQLDNTYLDRLVRYQHLLKQRNSLLKLYKGTGQVDRDLLASYDSQLLPLCKCLFEARTAFVQLFTPNFQKYYRYLVAAEEDAQLEYVSEVAVADFEQKFFDNLPQDLALQRTYLGIHRDEIRFTLGGYPLKKVGSQGQQKSFVIALRLTQRACLEEALKLKPLLLLDDIFDSLDEQRIDRLMELIAQQQWGQVFITDAKGERSLAVMQRTKVEQTLVRLRSTKKECNS